MYAPIAPLSTEVCAENLNNVQIACAVQWPPGSAHMLFRRHFDNLINVTEFNGELKEFILYACIQ